MGLINALTDNAFGRDARGRPVYRPLFGKEAPRLLPSAAAELPLRRSVKNFYRYIVFVVFPITIVLLIGMPVFADTYAGALPADMANRWIGYIGYFVSAGVGFVLALPAMLWIEWLGRDYPSIAVDQVAAVAGGDDSSPGENGTTLGGAFVLIALTLMVGLATLAVIYNFAADLLDALL